MNKLLKTGLILFIIFIPVFLSAQTTFTLLSWNIQDFGKTKSDEEIIVIAKTVRNYDIVALQEVVSGYGGSQAVAKLADALNRMGSKWDYKISDPTTFPPYTTERYAYLWKTSKVKIKGRGWLDKTLEQLIYREPYLARFQIKGKTVLLVNFHSRTYKDHPEEEIISFADYPARFPDDPIIIAGDFNAKSKSKVFRSLEQSGFEANLQNAKTTLKRKCDAKGNYTNHPIDFILYQRSKFENLESGVIDFVGDCDNLLKMRGISDHLPVWAKFEIRF